MLFATQVPTLWWNLHLLPWRQRKQVLLKHLYQIPNYMASLLKRPKSCQLLISKQLCPLLFPQQRLSDCRHIQHFDFILCWICDLLCHWFPRTWATSGSKECCRPRSRSCFHRVPWSGSSTAGLTPVVSPLLCDATHPWAGLTICSHGDCHNCYTRSFP